MASHVWCNNVLPTFADLFSCICSKALLVPSTLFNHWCVLEFTLQPMLDFMKTHLQQASPVCQGLGYQRNNNLARETRRPICLRVILEGIPPPRVGIHTIYTKPHAISNDAFAKITPLTCNVLKKNMHKVKNKTYAKFNYLRLCDS